LTITLSCGDDLSVITETMRNGGTVVFPTDTVYGLGCNPRSPRAIRRCFQIKERPSEKLLPVLFADKSHLEEFVTIGPVAETLASHFWPGKLTMILGIKEGAKLPFELTGGGKGLAVRIPNNACALKVIRACDGCLVGTSANISGRAPSSDPDNPELLSFATRCDFFVRENSRHPQSSLASTVIDLSQDERTPILVREGAIPFGEVTPYLTFSKLDISTS